MSRKNRLDEAKGHALRLYPAWAAANGHDPEARISGKPISGIDAMFYFQFLQKNHPEALDFSSPGDKWQTVHGWLSSAGISE